jgi:hypothetical protein
MEFNIFGLMICWFGGDVKRYQLSIKQAKPNLAELPQSHAPVFPEVENTYNGCHSRISFSYYHSQNSIISVYLDDLILLTL